MSRVKVVLRSNVENLGAVGEVATVAGGYARNYLVPRGLAAVATRGALRESEALQLKRAGRAERELSAAQELKATLESGKLKIKASAGPDGRLFGSITPTQIAISAKATLGVVIDRHDVHLKQPIRRLGLHEVKVKLHTDIVAVVVVEAIKQ